MTSGMQGLDAFRRQHGAQGKSSSGVRHVRKTKLINCGTVGHGVRAWDRVFPNRGNGQRIFGCARLKRPAIQRRIGSQNAFCQGNGGPTGGIFFRGVVDFFQSAR